MDARRRPNTPEEPEPPKKRRRAPLVRPWETHLARQWRTEAERLRGWMSQRRDRPAPPPPPRDPGPPKATLDLLRRLGVAMGRAGDSADRITAILEDVARAYGAPGVRFFVLPTGVFVSIDAGSSSHVDFAPASTAPLRLDQVDELYRLIDRIRQRKLTIDDATSGLNALLTSTRRFGPVVTILGTGILTVGLGMVLNPMAIAIPAYLVLGILVGLASWWAAHNHVLDAVLPVVAAVAVTWAALQFGTPFLGSNALNLVIPSLVTFLPGAALTMGAIELSGGSMVAGASRLVYGLERLLFLAFGILMGAELADRTAPANGSMVGDNIGAWAPWVGVFVFCIGQYISQSAPRRSFWWILTSLYVVYTVQWGAGLFLGPLGASFVAGVVVMPVAYIIQGWKTGPPLPVTFLPAFWLLVPGALGLRGVTTIVGASQTAGLADFLQALMSVAAIAVGVVLGAGLSERFGRTSKRWRGL